MVNEAIIVGRLGKDPEARYTPNGVAVTNFSVATSEKYKDQSGQVQEKTEWHNIVTWKQLAEVCAKYLVKGKLVYIRGQLQTRKWQDKEGNDRYSTEIVARDMKMLDSAGGDQRQSGQPNSQGYAADGRAAGSGQQQDPAFNPDDSIPF
jgi:single-strand DNA-binding protein